MLTETFRPPTDILWKFVAIAGIVLMCLGIGYPPYARQKHAEWVSSSKKELCEFVDGATRGPEARRELQQVTFLYNGGNRMGEFQSANREFGYDIHIQFHEDGHVTASSVSNKSKESDLRAAEKQLSDEYMSFCIDLMMARNALITAINTLNSEFTRIGPRPEPPISSPDDPVGLHKIREDVWKEALAKWDGKNAVSIGGFESLDSKCLWISERIKSIQERDTAFQREMRMADSLPYVGFSLMVVGFLCWYFLVQRKMDQLLNEEVRKSKSPQSKCSVILRSSGFIQRRICQSDGPG